jgi:hypothetical protein
MARPQQLQPGSINPAAKPVNVVLQTAAPQIARPGQPQAFPQPSLITTQGTGGTTFVQGENKFKDLARSLGNFNQALSRTGPQVVTALANYAIDQGEAEAIELAQRAMAKVDESTEVAEIERARANRQLAREDRPAGILMDFLNPYRQIGHQRGNAKLAAMEIQARMPGYVAQRAGEIDYTTADQGFSALEKIRADLNAEVTQKYGISPGSPGFTKFYLPALAQAGEKAGTKIAEDRVKFFDQQIPSQLATEIRATALNALNAGYVTTGVGDEAVVIPMMIQDRGQVVPNPAFHEAVQAKLNQIAQSYAARAGLPGQAQERFKDAFQILSAEADYGDNAAFKNFIDNVVPGENQAPWGLTYAQERIDSVIKYGQAGFARNKARGAQYTRTLQGILLDRIEGIPPGPARTEEAKKAMAEYIEQLQQSGRLVTPADRAAMTQVIKDTVEVSDELVFTQAPTGIEQNYMNQLSTTDVLTFNRQEWIDRMNEVANTLSLDPERQDQFIKNAMAEINQLDQQQTTFGPYKETVEKAVNTNIDRSLNLRYGQMRANYPVDVKESENRLREYAFERITKQLFELSEQQDGQLSFTEVRGVVNDVFKEIRELKNDTDDAKFLFPGMAGPSVEPGGVADFQDVSATQAKPAAAEDTPAPAPVQLYRVGELDTIPNRRQVLVEWNTRPIMHLQDIRVELNNVLNGGQLSPEVQRAWRDGGADNGFQYLMRQLDAFPSYNRTLDFPPDVMERIKERLVSFDALSNKLMSVASLQSRPQLSRLNNWALDIAFG